MHVTCACQSLSGGGCIYLGEEYVCGCPREVGKRDMFSVVMICIKNLD